MSFGKLEVADLLFRKLRSDESAGVLPCFALGCEDARPQEGLPGFGSVHANVKVGGLRGEAGLGVLGIAGYVEVVIKDADLDGVDVFG